MVLRLGAVLGLALILHGQAALLVSAAGGADHVCACRQRVCECAHSRPQPAAPAMPSCHAAPAPTLGACGRAEGEIAPAAVPYLLPAVTALAAPYLFAAMAPPRLPGTIEPPPRLSTPPPKA